MGLFIAEAGYLGTAVETVGHPPAEDDDEGEEDGAYYLDEQFGLTAIDIRQPFPIHTDNHGHGHAQTYHADEAEGHVEDVGPEHIVAVLQGIAQNERAEVGHHGQIGDDA